MAFEIQKQEIIEGIRSIPDEEIKFKIEKALDCLNDPPRAPIITNAISLARKSGYREIALKLANLAYETNPGNPFFLVELCTNLSFAGNSEEIIKKIDAFRLNNNIDDFPQSQRDAIMVTYAAALKGTGKFKEGIEVLERLNSDRRNVVELLAEMYYLNSEFQNAIKLLQTEPSTSKMQMLLNKSLDKISQTTIDDNQDKKSILIDNAKNIENVEVRDLASSALQALHNPSLSGQSQSRIVTRSIHQIRRAEGGTYRDLALNIASHAYEIDPNNPYYLGELCILLIQNGENRIVINKITDFMGRIEKNGINISPKNKEYLSVNLAHAYTGIGETPQGIQILKDLNSDAPNVIECLAELYYKNNEPIKTVDLLKNRKITQKMAFWLAKSYVVLSKKDNAIEVINSFGGSGGLEKLKAEILQHQQIEVKEPLQKSRRVWVIHGRNDKLKKEVFNFLRAIGLYPIEWEEARSLTGDAQPYIGDILEAAFDRAQAFVVLLTGDDEGKLKDRFIKPDDPEWERNPTAQARQNVIFEAGMAYGRDPTKVVFVQFGNIRQFSNISGRHILNLDNTAIKRINFINRLKAANCEIQDSEPKDYWFEVGNFDDESS